MAKGGFALDIKENGFGLIELAYHACAVHTNPVTDLLYLVLDDNHEPTDVLLPVASTAVAPTGKTIFQFDADEASDMVFLWRGRLNLMPWPTTMQFARVRALDFVNLVFRTYADGVMIDEYRVLNDLLVKLPALDTHDSYEHELVGTSTARSFFSTEDPEDMG